MLKFKWFVVLIFLFSLSLTACDLVPAPTPPETIPAEEILPAVPGYQAVQMDSLKGYLNTLGEEGQALLAEQPELSAAVDSVEQVISCYQDLGAVRAEVYRQDENPLSAGVIAIADKDVILNPLNFLGCANTSQAEEESSSAPGIQSMKVEPCFQSYTLTKDNRDFLILFAGTMPEVCQAFCSSTEGCEQ